MTDTISTDEAKKVRIVHRSGDTWLVNAFLSSLQNSAREEMVLRMREAKRLISEQFDVPYEQLELQEVHDKTEVSDGVEVQVFITRLKTEKGKPVVKVMPSITPRGSLFNDMIAELNLYYLDEFNKPITLDRIKTEIGKAGVALDLCDLDTIQKAIEKVIKNKNQAKGIPIAKGIFPEEGVDAQLEYTFYTGQTEEMKVDEYQKGRRVKEGDILCQKIAPTHGKKEGLDVRGGKIPAVKGLDFKLEAREGTELSADGNTVTALLDGLATMDRTNRRVYTVTGERVIPDKIEISVKPVIKINADDIDNLITMDSVEIEGTLKEGTSITTHGEVFLNGDVEAGSTVMAGSLVMINGKVLNSEVSSDDSIITNSDTKNTLVSAKENVDIRGIAENSEIIGTNVSVKSSQGSRIIAGKKITLGKATNDIEGRKTRIRVGRADYYQGKIDAGKREIEMMEASLKKIQAIFGEKIIHTVSNTNLQKTFIIYLRESRPKSGEEQDKMKVASLKKLLESVIPLKAMIKEKKAEVSKLEKRITRSSEDKPIVIIREEITDPVDITVNGDTLKINQD